MKVISGPASKELAEKISALTGYPNVPVASKIFPDGESYVRLEGSVQGEECGDCADNLSSNAGWEAFSVGVHG